MIRLSCGHMVSDIDHLRMDIDKQGICLIPTSNPWNGQVKKIGKLYGIHTRLLGYC